MASPWDHVEQQMIVHEDLYWATTIDSDGQWTAVGQEDVGGSVVMLRYLNGKWNDHGVIMVNGSQGTGFADTVRISGDWMAVSAPGQKIGSESVPAGAVHLYHFESGAWVPKQIILGSPGDELGMNAALDIDGDWLVIGKGGDTVCFYRLLYGSWSNKDEIGSNPANMRLSGVLAASEGGVCERSGAYWNPIEAPPGFVNNGTLDDLEGDLLAANGSIFRRTGSSWSKPKKLGVTGQTILSGKYAVVLDSKWKPSHAPASADESGQICVFERIGLNLWVPLFMCRSSYDTYGHIEDLFQLTGDQIVSVGQDEASFWTIGQTWEAPELVASKLIDPSPGEWEFFGASVATDGRNAIVGIPMTSAISEDLNSYQGSVAFYSRTKFGKWSYPIELKCTDGETEAFGWSVDSATTEVMSTNFVIGAPGNPFFGHDKTPGRAFVATSTGNPNGLSMKELIVDFNSLEMHQGPFMKYGDCFGASVAIAGVAKQLIAVGAPGRTVNGQARSGGVYVFAQNLLTGNWTHIDYLPCPSGQADYRFGSKVDLVERDGDYLLTVFGGGSTMLHQFEINPNAIGPGFSTYLGLLQGPLAMEIMDIDGAVAAGGLGNGAVCTSTFGGIGITNHLGNQHYVAGGELTTDSIFLVKYMVDEANWTGSPGTSTSNYDVVDQVDIPIQNPFDFGPDSQLGYSVDIAMYDGKPAILAGAPLANTTGLPGQETGAVLVIEGYQPPKFIYDISLINGLLLHISDLGYESEYDVNLDERLDLRDLVEAISRFEGSGDDESGQDRDRDHEGGVRRDDGRDDGAEARKDERRPAPRR
ncbi:MAG: hypothetical protein P8K80_07705 [Phycisphaerales bacterium]|nr:hypothetical protein [Phycisphaerales bacterium]